MGILRKTMSASTMGVIAWRSRSERAAAAVRSQSKAYDRRTKLFAREAKLDREPRFYPTNGPR